MQRKQRPPPTGGRGLRKMLLLTKNYAIGSGQNSLRLHFLQCFPIHTSSNWFMAFSMISGSSVNMPASKLRVDSAFIPIPAPVRFALPNRLALKNHILFTSQIAKAASIICFPRLSIQALSQKGLSGLSINVTISCCCRIRLFSSL